MKSSFLLLIFFCVALAVLGGSPSSKEGEVVIGDHLYFTGPLKMFRSREYALDYCILEGAELAKVTNKPLYDELRLALPVNITYWIDGIDKQSLDSFDLDNTCTSGEFDPSGFIPEEVDISATSCLVFVNERRYDSDKEAMIDVSRIESVDCTIPHRVLCSLSVKGCNESEREAGLESQV